jgi:hypothetical protein
MGHPADLSRRENCHRCQHNSLVVAERYPPLSSPLPLAIHHCRVIALLRRQRRRRVIRRGESPRHSYTFVDIGHRRGRPPLRGMQIPSTIIVLVVVMDIIGMTTLHRFRRDARAIERRQYQGRRRRRCRFLLVTNGRGRRRGEGEGAEGYYGGSGSESDRPTAHRPPPVPAADADAAWRG